MFYRRVYTVTLQLNSKWINVCICLCVHVCVWGASWARPNELSVCISNKSSVQRPRHCHPGPRLTLLGCKAVSFAIFMAPPPPYCVFERVHSPVCALEEGGRAGGLTQEANTVYISIMNQVAERERGMETERERVEGMEKAILPLFFHLLATNPCGAYPLHPAILPFCLMSPF